MYYLNKKVFEIGDFKVPAITTLIMAINSTMALFKVKKDYPNYYPFQMHKRHKDHNDYEFLLFRRMKRGTKK
jgi:hypothetical protein